MPWLDQDGKKNLLWTQWPTFVPRSVLVAWRVIGGEILNVFHCAAAICGWRWTRKTMLAVRRREVTGSTWRLVLNWQSLFSPRELLSVISRKQIIEMLEFSRIVGPPNRKPWRYIFFVNMLIFSEVWKKFWKISTIKPKPSQNRAMAHFWVTTHRLRTVGVDERSSWVCSSNSLSAYSEHSVSCGSGPGVVLCMPSWRHAPSEWTWPISSPLRKTQASGKGPTLRCIFIAAEKVLKKIWQHFIVCKVQMIIVVFFCFLIIHAKCIQSQQLVGPTV